MLQQNDFIITRQTANKNFIDSYAQWAPYFSLFSSLTGVLSVVLLVLQFTK